MQIKLFSRFSHSLCFILLLSIFAAFFSLLLTFSVSAGNDPLPNDSAAVAQVFGNMDGSLYPEFTTPPDWKNGMERDFKVLDVLSGNLNTCTGRIFLITENIVFWSDIREELPLSAEIADGLQRFDAEILPMLRNTFGNEANPGIDNDPRFHVVFTDRIGEAYNGYYSALDSADPRIRVSTPGCCCSGQWRCWTPSATNFNT